MTQKEEWLKAIGELEDYYLGKASGRYRCPLCWAARESCDVCLWVLICGKDCMSYVRKRRYSDFIWSLRDNRKSNWVKLRLKQLPEWRKWVEENF